MPGSLGFSAMHYLTIKYPDLPIAIISANEHPQTITKAIKLGASGFIPKSSSINNITSSIEKMLQGEIVIPTKNIINLDKTSRSTDDFQARLELLTPKQFRVLMMLMEGRTNSEIADEIFVTIATVKAHLSEIFKKLDASNRTQAAMMVASYLDVDDQYTKALE